MENFEAFGNKVEALPNGDLKVTKPDGSTFVIGKYGIKIDLNSMKSVGFHNIFDLKSHVIMREGDLTVHKAEFHDGGTVRIAYTAQGKLVEFSGHQIGQKITKDNEILIFSSTAMKDK